MDLILASASPRRKELLKKITEDFKVIPSCFCETSISLTKNPEDYVKKLSFKKAESVCKNLRNKSIVIGCDTVVVLENKILGKPKNKQDAFNMLRNLSGKWHEVYTGITIIDTNKCQILSDYVCTKVKFSDITDNEINFYVNTNEPMDKAGAYGIQGLASIFIEKIDGSYYNVVGFPLHKFYLMMKDMNIDLLKGGVN